MDCELRQRGTLVKRCVVCIAIFALFVMQAPAQTNPLRDSVAIVTEKLEYAPDSEELLLKRAGYNIELEQWDYAKTDYDRVLRRNPNNLTALFFRAYVNERLGRYGFSRLDYMNLLKIVPNHFEAKLGLALLNEKDKHLTEAMDQINQLVEQFPDSALAYAARAGIETERGMHLLAEYDYSEALLRDPTNKDYLLARIEELIALERYADARKNLDLLVGMGISRVSLRSYYDRLH